ncbi:MAG TPA: nucleotide disphospho-sugar-binding domain-containing protein [Terracidiphilus sp.]|jgi:MGT family glycosyltransferase
MRIGITVPAPVGHLNAMTALARRLQTRGHEVICIGVPDAARGVHAAGLSFEEYCGGQFPLGSYGERARILSTLTAEAGVAYTFQWIGDGCRAELDEAPPVLERLDLDGLVVDQVHPGVSVAAIGMGLPFVSVSCTPLTDLTGSTPHWLFPWPHEDTEAARERNRLGVAGFLKVLEPIQKMTVEHLESKGIHPDTSDVYWRVSKRAYLSQIPAAFDFPGESHPAHFHRTGPFHDGFGREPVAFPWERLTGAPLIYASMGTLQNGQADIFRAILAATERPGYQVVVSVGTNTAPESLALAQPDTIVVQRAPQLELLKRATLCVTHAGMNTTLEALAQGVPLVAIPITNDQPGVAARILANGTGLFLPLAQLNAEALQKLVDEVLRTPSYRERALAMKVAIAEVDGLGMAAELIENAFAAHD